MSNQAEENEVVEDVAEELEQVEELESENQEGETPEGDRETGEETEASESDEVVVSIGDESPPSEESTEGLPKWVKTLRHEHREKARENRQLKAELAQRQNQSAPAVTVGPKPTLADAEYDEELFEARLTAWHAQKRAADDAEQKKKDAIEADQKAWNAKLEAYAKHKASLKVANYEDAEAQALESLSIHQQGVILQGAKNPAAVVYVLGNNPGKLKELSAITNPVNFAFAVAELESKVSIKPRKTAPMPESKVSGSGRVPVSSDTKLKQLEEKADRTGDRTELVNYKRSLKLKAVS